MFVRNTVTSTMSFQLTPASSSTSRTFSNTARHCVSISYPSGLPVASSVTPGISLLPRLRGPIPERNSKLPTCFACGNAPTGSGARLLSKESLILRDNQLAKFYLILSDTLYQFHSQVLPLSGEKA